MSQIIKDLKSSHLSVNENWHRPIKQAVVVLAKTKEKEAALKLLEFVQGPVGKGIIQSYGYGVN